MQLEGSFRLGAGVGAAVVELEAPCGGYAVGGGVGPEGKDGGEGEVRRW
jgi:hypothetical protein